MLLKMDHNCVAEPEPAFFQLGRRRNLKEKIFETY